MIALLLAMTIAAAAHAPQPAPTLPPDFVYLNDVAPSILQDIRYAGSHNFLGRPVAGYQAPQCILTRQAAGALAKIQKELESSNLTLRVYDCYRPQRAVNDFIAWSKNTSDQTMKAEFYPHVHKAEFFRLGYLLAKSSHTRGSTVDVTIERLPARAAAPYKPGDPLVSCTAPFFSRYRDGSLDMGTGFDCMDPLSHPAADVGAIAGGHRKQLAYLMKKYGFTGIADEWWHFTLLGEPFPTTYFDFPITPK
jgi:zinc D-Ala-D-Ala dipeptidase